MTEDGIFNKVGVDDNIRLIFLKSGVKNLKDYGYQDVDISNILTNNAYKMIFKAMLEDHSNITKSDRVEKIRLALIKEIG